MSRIAASVIGGLAAAALAAPGLAQTPGPGAVPAIGARVRIVAPGLGPGWRVGMFNRTRQEPPCYLVLLFDPGPIRRVAATVPLAAVARLQVSTRPPGPGPADPDPGAAALDGEAWAEVALDAARAASRAGCPATIARDPA
jgi:hypothetical protein